MQIEPRDNYRVDIMLPTRWYRQARYRVIRKITVGDVTIPAGFVTDGATVPIFLRWAFPPVGRYFPAAMAHDYLLVKGYSWKHSNAVFRQTLLHCNIPTWQRVLMGAATSVYGTFKELGKKLRNFG